MLNKRFSGNLSGRSERLFREIGTKNPLNRIKRGASRSGYGQMTVNLCPVSGVSAPRFRGICAPFQGYLRPVSGVFSKRYKRLKSLYKRGNAGIENRLIPLNRIKRGASKR